MGNPRPMDRRFDKPAMESLVDLINKSNKSYIPQGSIDADRVTPVPSDDPKLYNTSVRVCLKGTLATGPYSTMTYARLDISEYLPFPDFFHFEDADDTNSLFQQLREKHHIWLSGEDCAVVIGPRGTNGLRTITFVPMIGHYVWTGQLTVEAGSLNHIGNEIAYTDLTGLTLGQLTA